MKKVVIVIPIYKANPQTQELASFRQCLTVLRKYDIFILTYTELDLSLYEKVAKDCQVDIKKEYFNKHYFESISGYNRLCLNPTFYKRFFGYEYMLIYQLDAWVFKDELDKWCDKGYDYIGAPWFTENEEGYTYDFVGNVGNGGLSLRKIAFCYKVLCRNKFAPILPIREIYRKSTCKKMRFLRACVRAVGLRNNLAYYLSDIDRKVKNEDRFFSVFKNSYVKCNIPNPKDAIGFAFEVHPSFLFSLNNNSLPFGCHAYRKNEYDTFWSKYIDDNE